MRALVIEHDAENRARALARFDAVLDRVAPVGAGAT